MSRAKSASVSVGPGLQRRAQSVALVACLALPGCGTFLVEPVCRAVRAGGSKASPPLVYGGVRSWFWLLDDGGLFLLPLALVDFPLSLVADTIILPYTIAKNAMTRGGRPAPAQGPYQEFKARTFAPTKPRGASFAVRLSQYTHANKQTWVTMHVRSTGREVSVVLLTRDGTRLATQRLAANRHQEVRARLRGPALRGWKDVRVQAVTTTGETFDVEGD